MKQKKSPTSPKVRLDSLVLMDEQDLPGILKDYASDVKTSSELLRRK